MNDSVALSASGAGLTFWHLLLSATMALNPRVHYPDEVYNIIL